MIPQNFEFICCGSAATLGSGHRPLTAEFQDVFVAAEPYTLQRPVAALTDLQLRCALCGHVVTQSQTRHNPPDHHNIEISLKFRSLLNFLASILRDEGGYEYKKAIVDTIIVIISEIPESKESGLTHLCEFIEDCEFTQLAVKILHLLGKEGMYLQRNLQCICGICRD